MIFELARASTTGTRATRRCSWIGQDDHLTHAEHRQHRHSRVPRHHLNAWCRITIMVANPAPLMMSAKTYCSSLIEAFIPVSPFPLSSHGSARSQAPRCPTGSNRLSELDPTAVA